MKIYVIDNGGQWTHREWRTLRDLDVDAQIIPNTAPISQIQDATALVLSGGAPRLGLQQNLGNCGLFLDKITVPILGICAGHQFMGRHFGGEVSPSKIPEFGKIELEILQEDDMIFNGLPKKSIVWLSHNDEITILPKDFEHLAESKSCKIQAMKHRNKPFYGLQFHPEVEHTEYGEHIFKNFVKICTD